MVLGRAALPLDRLSLRVSSLLYVCFLANLSMLHLTLHIAPAGCTRHCFASSCIHGTVFAHSSIECSNLLCYVGLDRGRPSNFPSTPSEPRRRQKRPNSPHNRVSPAAESTHTYTRSKRLMVFQEATCVNVLASWQPQAFAMISHQKATDFDCMVALSLPDRNVMTGGDEPIAGV
jgi:hypothetical protein